ncbi:metallophosphoesterase [Paenibacillus sp. FSL L8-0709]|uniref:metallophosphoesterase n=1 Tax=Paenibacillus sp. FSL L8-0709 TaxID=2975312 RepID=UPI0030FCC9D5
MSKICVLHLSDLHISERDDFDTKGIREALLKDLLQKKAEKGLVVDIVAITGDSVDKGGTQGSFQIAENYYIQLSQELGIDRERLLLVPGNHDFPRRKAVEVLLANTHKENYYDEVQFNEYWETFETRQKQFFAMAEKVTGVTDYSFTKYGGAVRNIKINNSIIKVIMINSSWSCVGKGDYGNLMVGKPQLEELTRISKSLPEADLTIGLVHHPFEWLDKDEREMCVDYLTSSQKIKVDAILHGHIHSGKITRFSNPDKDLFSLISGIGYPEKGDKGIGRNKVSNCRYAIYTFDTISGNVNVQLRISSESGTFSSDTLMYDLGKENGIFDTLYKEPLIEKFTAVTQEVVLKRSEFLTIEVDFVPKISDWVGRGDELLLPQKREISVISITGVGGQGKTALASEYLRKYSRGDSPKYDYGIWIDCRELPESFHYKLIESLEKVSGGLETVTLYKDERLEDTVKRFLKYLNKYKLLVVFDNIDAYVKVDSEGPVEELKPLFNSLCNNEHSSLVVFTCRPPLVHSSSNFQHIQLKGLDTSVAADFFARRGIKSSGENAEIYAREVFKLTNGHPWWLGLIAGQVNVKQESLKKCVERLKRGEETTGGSIQEYFKDIWQQLNKERQNLLRYLVVGHRPLNEDEVSLAVTTDYGPDKLKKELRRLTRLGLIEPHESGMNDVSTLTYQVHPLIREFVHQSYPPASQERFVKGVLCVFLPQSVLNYLFNKTEKPMIEASMRPAHLIDSIETCLNSRSPEKVLNLIGAYTSLLYDGGYHHQYYSLGCRILDSTDWKDVKMVTLANNISFLHSFLPHLCSIGENLKCDFYLRKYNSMIEEGTHSHVNYLSLASRIAWIKGNNIESIRLAEEHILLSSKLEVIPSTTVLNYHALALRDSGEVKKALEIFQQFEMEEKSDKSTYYGNCARCYFKLNDFQSAERYIRKSLKILIARESYHDIQNIGYAYLWIADIMFERQNFKDSKAFLLLAESIWKEYAPGLLFKIHEVEHKFILNETWHLEPVSLEEAKIIENRFLDT